MELETEPDNDPSYQNLGDEPEDVKMNPIFNPTESALDAAAGAVSAPVDINHDNFDDWGGFQSNPAHDHHSNVHDDAFDQAGDQGISRWKPFATAEVEPARVESEYHLPDSDWDASPYDDENNNNDARIAKLLEAAQAIHQNHIDQTHSVIENNLENMDIDYLNGQLNLVNARLNGQDSGDMSDEEDLGLYNINDQLKDLTGYNSVSHVDIPGSMDPVTIVNGYIERLEEDRSTLEKEIKHRKIDEIMGNALQEYQVLYNAYYSVPLNKLTLEQCESEFEQLSDEPVGKYNPYYRDMMNVLVPEDLVAEGSLEEENAKEALSDNEATLTRYQAMHDQYLEKLREAIKAAQQQDARLTDFYDLMMGIPFAPDQINENLEQFDAMRIRFNQLMDDYPQDLPRLDRDKLDKMRADLAEKREELNLSDLVEMEQPGSSLTVTVTVSTPDRQLTEANNIDRILTENQKGAREIYRLNIDALLYMYMFSDEHQRGHLWDALNGQMGHIHISAPGGQEKFSLLLERNINFSPNFESAIKNELIKNLKGYLANKEDNKRRTSEYGSCQRYQNMLTMLEEDNKGELCGLGVKTAQRGVDSIDTAIGLWKRTTALKHERYVMDVSGNIDDLPPELRKNVATAMIDYNLSAKREDKVNDASQVAFLECQQNQKYGPDDSAKVQDSFKLTKKGLSKKDFVEKHWNQVEPLVIEWGGKSYLITAKVYFDKERQKDLIGFYKRDITGAEPNPHDYAKSLDSEQRKRVSGDRSISDTDKITYAGEHSNAPNALTVRIQEYLENQIIECSTAEYGLGAPCLVHVKDFQGDRELSRGAKWTGPKKN
jgi:hypothetical protein